MQIIRIEVGHEPRLIEMENTLKAFQKAVWQRIGWETAAASVIG